MFKDAHCIHVRSFKRLWKPVVFTVFKLSVLQVSFIVLAIVLKTITYVKPNILLSCTNSIAVNITSL